MRVQIFATMNIAQNGAFAFDNHNRLALKPIPHLRKRMPDITMIQVGERVHWPAKSTKNIAQNGAFAFDNHNRLALKPIPHLRKRMPDITMIQVGERVHWPAKSSS